MNKFRPILIVILLHQFVSASGQDDGETSESHKKPFVSAIEVIGGLNHSSYWGEYASDDQIRNTNTMYGVGLERTLIGNVKLGLRVLFERKGYKAEYTSTFYDVDNNIYTSRFIQGKKLDYTTIQALVKIYAGHSMRFHVAPGFYWGFLRRAKTYTYEYNLQGNLKSIYSSDIIVYQNYDLGLSLAIGYQVRVWGRAKVTFQLYDNLGLSNINKPDFPSTPNKNNVIGLSTSLSLDYK